MSATNKASNDNPETRSSSKIPIEETVVDLKTPLMTDAKAKNGEEMELNDRKTEEKGENSEDEHDGAFRPRRTSVSFPHSEYGIHNHQHDMEVASMMLEDIPDINVYQHKKTLAQGMMDLALFSANANQLRYVLDSYQRHPYYYPSMIFICISLLLQVAIGVLLIWNATYNVKDEKEVCRANRINNYTVIGIFLVTVINVFISAFGVADPPNMPSATTISTNST